MMASLRQTILNLMAAGLFHLLEQRLGSLSQDACFRDTPLAETKFEAVAA